MGKAPLTHLTFRLLYTYDFAKSVFFNHTKEIDLHKSIQQLYCFTFFINICYNL